MHLSDLSGFYKGIKIKDRCLFFSNSSENWWLSFSKLSLWSIIPKYVLLANTLAIPLSFCPILNHVPLYYFILLHTTNSTLSKHSSLFTLHILVFHPLHSTSPTCLHPLHFTSSILCTPCYFIYSTPYTSFIPLQLFDPLKPFYFIHSTLSLASLIVLVTKHIIYYLEPLKWLL